MYRSSQTTSSRSPSRRTSWTTRLRLGWVRGLVPWTRLTATGIHNEPGFRKVSPIPPAAALVHDLLTVLTNVDDKERAYLDFKHDGQDAVVLLVNNLGGLSEIELAVVMKEAGEWLAGRNIIVERAISGLFMSALNLPGCSISLILLPRAPVVPDFESQISFDAQTILDLLDAPTEAPGWKWFHKGRPGASIISDTRVVETRTALKGPARALRSARC